MDRRTGPGAEVDELTAVTAHWLLGRVGTLRGIVDHLAANHMDDVQRAELGARCRVICEQVQRSLEEMARGTLDEAPPQDDLGIEIVERPD